MNVATFYPIFLSAAKVTIDSRNIQPNDVFFAFSGENFNAATLAQDAIAKGASAVIVEQEAFENTAENIFYVPSTLKFLQELAAYHRDQLNIPVIALTGSNGKTTTKEIIHAVLSQKYSVQYTKGNLNNHIGVPLTLLSINDTHDMAVVEMGANHQKEIAELCQIAKPDYGYITNFGKAHLEGFGGFEGVIKGKSELYDYLKSASATVLVNQNDLIQMEKTSGYERCISFGGQHADYQFQELTKDKFVGLSFQGNEAYSNLTGSYNFTNLCAAASLGLHFGLSFQEIKTAIESYQPTNMRSQIVEKNGKTLVLDTYNANPSSMAESLKNFSKFKGSKTVILGDMLELGEASQQEHQNILDLALKLRFNEIITVGNLFMEINKSGNAFGSTASLSEYLKNNSIASENILLKGSRGIALESILDFIA
ncbi:UDP-N-acetylmuramoyl-tripeptide--D-alanyl-D-alanine ligase [Chryseobacterium sp. 6424]|uniref:UDP-N-acetylmuramoyl-tripeptide--D-alanyl-D- alanine ligase n=1 Tax=Chryseobacterium sp. 6424 TaxID=2039166 RepID=UPI000EFA6E76|nr:UDP-N-acetylmuramoyl-tripeptide--D-alanyl-D-alanine ligase [Chryseobacterium sp. 6424]AYO57299.1 UDP-N-acetylmuramoyl-tripeptide--D-alanyl-D-alanine ligase [Chryseobacterium sp. 6424]